MKKNILKNVLVLMCSITSTALSTLKNKNLETNLLMQLTIPELSLPSMHPMKITKIEIPASDSGSFSLHQKVTDVEVHNLINSEVSSSELTLGDEEHHLKIKVFNPLVNITGNYELDGKVMLLEVKGQGPFVIQLVSGKFIEKNGKKYLTIEETTFKVEPQHAVIKFDNLFNGNQELGKSVNDIFNQNWKDLYGELGSSYEEAIGQFIQESFRRIFAKVSFDDLFPQ
ncbi:hypothetical protein RI129_013019 [Pyrocoelia pectoralis]|uniref:Uncharacterized protein n=1 Tax=Pyrocoelia pectoralis TaxID=417401 RepID=A0AAN7V1Y7_9COLE